MIHYHGTPITPRSELNKMAGLCFCVSYAAPNDAEWCLSHAQSIMWDNGAFPIWRSGKKLEGPCLVPVGFGLMAPSGVLMIGLALVLRDAVHEAAGAMAALAAIALGALVSWFLAPPALVVASVAAFALAELADFAVYAPLRKRGLAIAVLASGVVGALVDSALFLWLAFGSLDHMAGQVVGKFWMSALAAVFLMLVQRRRVAA